MSRSNPETILQNPAVRFFEWKGDTGELKYYDREKEENVIVATPFRFLVLDNVAQVGGGIKKHNEYVGYFSNAVRVRNIKTHPLVVKSKINGHVSVEAEGVWEHIKGTLQGAKFIQGLYIGFFDGDKLTIGYLKLKGAANSAWIDFNKTINRRDICAGAYTIKGRSEEKQNGNTTYYEPVFSWTEQVKPETEQAALDLDVELQKYLTAYFAQQALVEPSEPEYSGESFDDIEERKAIAASAGNASTWKAAEFVDDSDSIPF